MLIVLFVLRLCLNLSLTTDLKVPRFYCNERERKGVCTREYKPVCGWFKKTVNCFKYPCAIDASNKCVACSNRDVEFATPGKCPK